MQIAAVDRDSICWMESWDMDDDEEISSSKFFT